MAWRDVEGTLGAPSERRLPVIPGRWRLPALALTVVVCVAIFVTAVLVGLHG